MLSDSGCIAQAPAVKKRFANSQEKSIFSLGKSILIRLGRAIVQEINTKFT